MTLKKAIETLVEEFRAKGHTYENSVDYRALAEAHEAICNRPAVAHAEISVRVFADAVQMPGVKP